MSSDGSQYTAFLSHASSDRDLAEGICTDLEVRGLRCWIAPRDVQPGVDYAQEILRGIEASRCLILILSAEANASPFVRREVERAVSKNKTVFTIRVERVEPSPSLELFISSTQWIDAWDRKLTEHLNRLATDLGGHAQQASADPPPIAGPARSVILLVGATLALSALVALLLFLPGTQPSSDGSLDEASSVDRDDVAAAVGTALRSFPRPGDAIDPSVGRFKGRAEQLPQWFFCDSIEAFCRFQSLKHFHRGIKRIHFGETESNFDRVIDLSTSAEGATDESYGLDYIPYRPGAKALYVRLEYENGESSDIRPAEWSGAPMRHPRDVSVVGLRLDPIGARELAAAFPLYVLQVRPGDPLQFMPAPPLQTAAALYAFDEGGFLRADRLGPPSRQDGLLSGFRFRGPVKDTPVRVKFALENGSEVGPFRYELRDVAKDLDRQIAAAAAAAFKARAINAVAAIRIDPPRGVREEARTGRYPPTIAREVRDRDQQWVWLLASRTRAHGIGVTHALLTDRAVICIPSLPIYDNKGDRQPPSLEAWSAVKAIHVGTRPGETKRIVEVRMSSGDLRTRGLARKPADEERAEAIWLDVLPFETGGVYVRFAYHDGTLSDEIRVPIDDHASSEVSSS